MRSIAPLNKFFAQEAPSLLGIDLGDTHISVSEVSWKKSSYCILNCQQRDLSLGQFWQNSLEEILSNSNFKSRQACLGVDYSAVVVKTIELDAALHDDEVAVEINERAHNYLNYPANELLIDFERIGKAENDAKLVKFRWIAIKKSDVHSKIDTLSQLGIRTVIVDLNPYALLNLVRLLIDSDSENKCYFLVFVKNEQAIVLLYDAKTIFSCKEILHKNREIILEEIVRIIGQMRMDYPDKAIDKLNISGINFLEQEKIKQNVKLSATDMVEDLAKQPWLQRIDSSILNNHMLSIGLAMRVNKWL